MDKNAEKMVESPEKWTSQIKFPNMLNYLHTKFWASLAPILPVNFGGSEDKGQRDSIKHLPLQ